MSADEPRGYEPWAWPAFALGGATALLVLYLGLRPGGRGPILAYTFGPLVLGVASALSLVAALAWCLARRPLLQRGRVKPLAVLAVSLWVCSFPVAYPSSHEGHPSAVRFRLPFDGEWRVHWGGDKREQNVLVLNPSRRFGFVFAHAPTALVRAPAPGRVVATDRALVLAVAQDEFLVVEGLAPETLRVAVGTDVGAGEPLGELGVEGLLGIHLEDAPRPGTGEGIPLLFHGYRADGRVERRHVPVRGQRVRAADPPAAER